MRPLHHAEGPLVARLFEPLLRGRLARPRRHARLLDEPRAAGGRRPRREVTAPRVARQRLRAASTQICATCRSKAARRPS